MIHENKQYCIQYVVIWVVIMTIAIIFGCSAPSAVRVKQSAISQSLKSKTKIISVSISQSIAKPVYTNAPMTYAYIWWSQSNNGVNLKFPVYLANTTNSVDVIPIVYDVEYSTNLGVNWTLFTTTNQPPVKIPTLMRTATWRVGHHLYE